MGGPHQTGLSALLGFGFGLPALFLPSPVEIDAGTVLDLLLTHENPIVREASKAAYWQAIAQARTEQVKELTAEASPVE